MSINGSAAGNYTVNKASWHYGRLSMLSSEDIHEYHADTLFGNTNKESLLTVENVDNTQTSHAVQYESFVCTIMASYYYCDYLRFTLLYIPVFSVRQWDNYNNYVQFIRSQLFLKM